MKSLYATIGGLSAVLMLSMLAFGQQDTPKMINGGVLNGKAISLPKPVYPDSAKVAGVKGAVKVQVTIDENGNIESAQAVKDESDNNEASTEYADAKAALRAAAESAALEAKFSPTLLNGIPVKIRGVIVYNFSQGEGSVDQSMPGGTGSLNSKAIELPDPEYPAAAKAVRAVGTVKVQITIDEYGNVIAAKALSGHPLLQSAAVAAAQKARFEPGKEPVKTVGVLTYNFVVPDKKP
jgi:TonB family protein